MKGEMEIENNDSENGEDQDEDDIENLSDADK